MVGALSVIKARAPVTGGNFGVWGGMFSTFDCAVKGWRQKEDMWNAIISGFMTGGCLAARSGPKGALTSAVMCGILLSVFEGVGVLVSRVFNEGTRPQLPPRKYAANIIIDETCHLPYLSPFDICVSNHTLTSSSVHSSTRKHAATAVNHSPHDCMIPPRPQPSPPTPPEHSWTLDVPIISTRCLCSYNVSHRRFAVLLGPVFSPTRTRLLNAPKTVGNRTLRIASLCIGQLESCCCSASTARYNQGTLRHDSSVVALQAM